MTISLGYSQTFPLDFSDPADLFTGFDGVSASIVSDGGNDVLQIVGGTQTWDNSQLNLAQNINLSNDANNTITFRFKASAGSSGQHLLKFEGLSGTGAAVAEGFFNSTGTDWQTITINFGAGLGNYSKVVIFTDSGAASNGWNNAGTGTYLIDDLAGGTNVVPVTIPAPTVAATTPTKDAADVISVFSNAYTNIVGTAFAPNWGQNPTFQQVNIAGNATNRYLNFNFVGNTFSAGGVNASSMQQLHLDIWTPDCTAFDVYILDGTAPEQKVTLTPTVNQWNSFDIDLSLYTSLTKSAIVEFKFEKTDAGLKTIYLDNIYFWKAPAGTFTYYADTDSDGYGAGAAVLVASPTAPEGYSVNNSDCAPANAAIYPGATEIADGLDNNCNGVVDEGFPPSIGAPVPPARNAWDVKSIFSGAYSNATLSELPTSWSSTAIAPFTVESIGGNATWKFGGEFLGMVTNYSTGIDLSEMTMMHIDYWTPDPNLIIVKLVNTVNGGEANTILEDPTQTGSWRSRDIPMSLFGGSLNKSKITQLLIDPQTGGSTVYIDNFYFYRPATLAPSPTITNFSVAAKVVGAADFPIFRPTSNSTGTFSYTSSNPDVATIVNGNQIHVVSAGTTTITATQAARGNYGSGFTTAVLVVSYPNPSTAATVPTKSASRVISIFSDVYTNVAGTGFFQTWGSFTSGSTIQNSGNFIQKYANLSYVGTQFASPINASAMDMLHLDIWTPDCTAFKVFLISNGENAVTLNPTLSGWNSFDIDLSLYSAAGRNLSAIQQFKFERVGDGTKTVYLDNIYFFNNTTKVQTSQASTTLATLSTDIMADNVVGATDYRFKVVSNGSTEVIERGNRRFFNLSMLSNGGRYNTAYTISVATKYNGTWFKYGADAVVTTPAAPTTKVQASQCGATLASNGTDILADNVQFATAYRFRVFVNGDSYEINPTGNRRYFDLTALPIPVTAGTTYAISVAVQFNGVWGEVTYGAECNVTTPGTASNARQATSIATSDFSVVAYPNPSNTTFNLQVNGSNNETASVLVFDMTGRQIENKVVKANDIESISLGQNYSTGIYNVVVSQGMNSRTVRLVKK